MAKHAERDHRLEGDRPRILLVDDSPELRALVRAPLVADGFDVLEAGDGREALDLLGLGSALPPNQPIELLITDERMPFVSGLALLASLRAVRSPLPVILMTSFGDPALHARARSLGAVLTLDKPIPRLALRDAARRLLDPPWW